MSRAKNELYVLIMCDNMYLLISEGWKPVGLMAALSSESFVKLSVVCFYGSECNDTFNCQNKSLFVFKLKAVSLVTVHTDT